MHDNFVVCPNLWYLRRECENIMKNPHYRYVAKYQNSQNRTSGTTSFVICKSTIIRVPATEGQNVNEVFYYFFLFVFGIAHSKNGSAVFPSAIRQTAQFPSWKCLLVVSLTIHFTRWGEMSQTPKYWGRE